MSARSDASRAAADRNLADAFDVVRLHLADPRGGRRRFGAVDAIATGHELAFYNPILVLDRSSADEDIQAAVLWVESVGLATSVHLQSGTNPSIRTRLEAAGFVADDEEATVMALTPIPRPPASPPDVRLRAGGSELAEDWYRALEAGERFRRTFRDALLDDPNVRIAVADVAGEPVAGAAAVGFGETLGIYAVGTLEHARRRGYGRAVTWAAIDAGAGAWGSTRAILQSTQMGVAMYRSMGFDEIATITIFKRPEA
jgi:ribosomal protein S18 acetylase RimI-like enzyme